MLDTEIIQDDFQLVDQQAIENEMISGVIEKLDKRKLDVVKQFHDYEDKKKHLSSLKRDKKALRLIAIDNVAKAKAISDVAFELAATTKTPQMLELAFTSLKTVAEMSKALAVLHKDISIENGREISLEQQKIKTVMLKEQLKEMQQIEKDVKMKDKSGNEISFESES